MADFDAFLRWTCVNPLDDRVRHAYARWLVLASLDCDPSDHRPAADPAEPLLLDRGALGISSAGFFRDPQQEEPGAVSFPIPPLACRAWVFCLLESRDLQARRHWRFWVVPSRRLHPERRSIALQPLLRSHGDGIGGSQLVAQINAALA